MSLHRKSLSFPSSNPLFSTIITLYTLILLYFPTTILFSPVLLSTSLLVLSLLRLGATQKTNQHNKRDPDCEDLIISAQISPSVIPHDSSLHDCKCVSRVSNVGPTTEHDPNPNPDPFYDVSFVGAPLEAIHEEYEDEEEITLMMYYPDTDTDTGTGMDSLSGENSPVIGNWDSPENLCFRWDEEDREGLIEIELDGKRNSSEAEEENLIEIDLTPGNFPVR